MKFKSSVRMDVLTPQMVLGAMMVQIALQKEDIEMIITSISDGTHSKNSLHYVGNAIDIRTRHVPSWKHSDMVSAIKGGLGQHFDVVLESDHIHIEYDPKGKPDGRSSIA